MNDKLSANSLETVQNINSQLGQIKKEYVEEMRQNEVEKSAEARSSVWRDAS